MEVVLDSKPRPKPRPISPGTVAERSPDSDAGFNIGRDRRRRAVREERRTARLSSALNPQVLVEEASNSAPQLPAAGAAEGVHKSCANPPEEEGSEGDCSENGGSPPDSDLERRALNRAVQLGLDPNDGAVCELLRHGRPGFAVGSDEGGHGGHSEQRADSALGEADDQPELEQQPEGSEDEDQGDEEDDEERGPTPPYELNYNNWTRYATHGFKIGEQTAVDCLTRYRATRDSTWLPLPHSWVAPRFADPQQEDEAQLHEKLCIEEGLPPDQHFGAVLDSDKAAQAAAMESEAKKREDEALKAEAARKERARGREEEALKERARRVDEAAKKERVKRDEAGKEQPKQGSAAKEAAKTGSLLSRKQIQNNLYQLGMAMEKSRDQRTPTESDPTGSDYSETEREVRKRKEFMQVVDESSSDGGEDKESPLKDKSRGKGKAAKVGGRDAASNNKGKGRATLPDANDVPATASDLNAKGKAAAAASG